MVQTMIAGHKIDELIEYHSSALGFKVKISTGSLAAVTISYGQVETPKYLDFFSTVQNLNPQKALRFGEVKALWKELLEKVPSKEIYQLHAKKVDVSALDSTTLEALEAAPDDPDDTPADVVTKSKAAAVRGKQKSNRAR